MNRRGIAEKESSQQRSQEADRPVVELFGGSTWTEGRGSAEALRQEHAGSAGKRRGSGRRVDGEGAAAGEEVGVVVAGGGEAALQDLEARYEHFGFCYEFYTGVKSYPFLL